MNDDVMEELASKSHMFRHVNTLSRILISFHEIRSMHYVK